MRAILAALVVLGLAALQALLDSDSGVRTWWALRQEVAEVQARSDRLGLEISHLEGEREALESEPFALEAAIREELDWVRPGEVLVRLPRRDPSRPPLP